MDTRTARTLTPAMVLAAPTFGALRASSSPQFAAAAAFVVFALGALLGVAWNRELDRIDRAHRAIDAANARLAAAEAASVADFAAAKAARDASRARARRAHPANGGAS